MWVECHRMMCYNALGILYSRRNFIALQSRYTTVKHSWSLEREDIAHTHCVRSATDRNLGVALENRKGYTCVRILEELEFQEFPTVLNCSVLTLECDKVPS
jgi:hypothetical protein